MRASGRMPSIVPNGDDQDVYLVLDDFGRFGRSWCETDEETADFETMIADLLDGQYSNPIKIACFNIAEGWSRDASEGIAQELRRRCDLEGRELPAYLADFVERHERERQLTLRLA